MGKKFANEDTRLRTRHTLEILGNDDMFESEGKERAALFKQRLAFIKNELDRKPSKIV